MDRKLLDYVEKALVDWWMNLNHHNENESDRKDQLVKMLLELSNPYKKVKRSASHSAAEPSPRKNPRLSSNRAAESSVAKEDKQNFQLRTLKDLALLILDNCRDEDLKDFSIVIVDSFQRVNKENRNHVWAEISKCDNNKIEGVGFKGFFSMKDGSLDLDRAYENAERMLFPLVDLQAELKTLFEKKQLLYLEDESIMSWDESFVVDKTGKEVEAIDFPVDIEKGRVYVITGESGSGKSWFAKKWLPAKHPDASFIYYELSDEDAKFAMYKPKSETLRDACQVAMQALTVQGENSSMVYDAVSELARQNNALRNDHARTLFQMLMQKAVSDDNGKVASWWHQPSQKLEKLAIIIDEVGKAPDFARGLIDEVHCISCDICNRGLAKKVMLVLVGSGLDHFISEDSIDFEGDAEERALYGKFGTDPSKSHLTVLKGPDLTSRHAIHGIPLDDIKKGTYSQVLATNTRMLTRGIVPILKSSMNTLGIDNLSARRVELGSTNVVMDYAARIYIQLNALSRLQSRKPKEFEALLLKQFRLLMYSETRKLRKTRKLSRTREVGDGISLGWNPAFEYLLAIAPLRCDYETVLKAGLITANITSTSKALRYLACKGQTAPLYAQDGVAFEVVLQNHLVRLCRAEYNLHLGEDKGQNENYFCDRYALLQAWPPSSTEKRNLLRISMWRRR